ncbi:hypothetical protein ACFL00_03290 [Pseudomonadota bacterium]
MALAWPRFQASFRYLPVDIAIDRYFADRQIPSDRLPFLIEFAQQSIAFNDYYRYRDGLSQLHYLRALDPFSPALERIPAYREAESEVMISLQQAPAQPEAWLRLATIRWILHDEPETIIAPWKMSIFTGRTDSSLLASRVEMGLAYYEFLDPEAVSMLRDQLLLAWRARSSSLVRILARRDRNLVVTRELLAATHPLALDEMKVLLEKLR